MAFMVYFVFFGCVLAPLVAMFAVYGYIYGVVRRHIARIAAAMPPPAVAMATVQQPQDPAVSQSSSSTSRGVATEADNSNNAETAAPTTRQGRTMSALIQVTILNAPLPLEDFVTIILGCSICHSLFMYQLC